MIATSFEATPAFAAAMDARDPLAAYRNEFHLPKGPDGSDSVYLCGNSLGLQPKNARDYVEQELEDWKTLGVEGHFHGRHPWLTYHRTLTDQTARLVGAKPVEVVVMNTLTVNLHLIMVSFYRPTTARYKIIVEGGAFPSDQYAIKSQIAFHGLDPATALIELTPRPGESLLRDEDIYAVIDREGPSTALILLGGVNYSTGQAFDLPGITRAGHAHGCVVAFDLAHAAGNLAVQLHDADVDFAVWCSYKYLNGGPGCPAGCFVHERHAQAMDLPRFAGWWGHDEKTRFKMGPEFHPMPGAEGWQVSNPPILALAALRASMELFDRAGMQALRRKSVSLTGYLEFLLDQQGFDQQRKASASIISPRNPEWRGSQISLKIKGYGREIVDRLRGRGVVCDWREPDILRVAPAAMYNSFSDVFRFVQIFAEVLAG